MVASAKPFVPELASTMRGTIRGDVPLPEGRPYTLGHTSADVASIGATSVMSASRRQPALAWFADYEDGDMMPAARPVSAYAPVRGGFADDTMSGRGLY